MMRGKSILLLAMAAVLAMPSIAAATDDSDVIQKIDQQFGLTCYRIHGNGPLFCGKSPTATTVSAAPAAPIAPVLSSATPPVMAEPSLTGFRQAFRIEPVLVQHGDGSATLTKWHGAGTAGQIIEKLLPSGWQVYTKPGASGMLSTPVLFTETGSHPWVRVLKSVLKQSGLHAAIWWDRQILALWPAPVMPSYAMPVSVTETPSAKKPTQKLVHAPKQIPSEPEEPEQAVIPLKVKGAKHRLPTNFHVGPATAMRPASIDNAVPLQGATPIFVLNQGDLILTDLQQWASQSGWTVVWQVPEDWQVPNTTSFSGDFQKAVTQVIQALSANGANVHAVFHTANNTVVISGAGGGE